MMLPIRKSRQVNRPVHGTQMGTMKISGGAASSDFRIRISARFTMANTVSVIADVVSASPVRGKVTARLAIMAMITRLALSGVRVVEFIRPNHSANCLVH